MSVTIIPTAPAAAPIPAAVLAGLAPGASYAQRDRARRWRGRRSRWQGRHYVGPARRH